MKIELVYIGKSADDLRFFIRKDGIHAGGVTVHSVKDASFSYGIAIAPKMRRQGVAKAALALLFDEMRRRGFETAVAQIAQDNAASLALHRSLGFACIGRESDAVVCRLSLR